MKPVNSITTSEAAKLLDLTYWIFWRKAKPLLNSNQLYGTTGPHLYDEEEVRRLKERLESGEVI